MKRVLFVVGPEQGHINPCIAPACWLQEHGHHVAFYSATDISDQLLRAGLKSFYGRRQHDSEFCENESGRELAAKVRDRTWLRKETKRLLLDQVPEQVAVLKRIVLEYKPDAIVTDPTVYAGAIVAESLEIPWIAVSTSLNPVVPALLKSELIETIDWLSSERAELLAGYALQPEFKVCDIISPFLNIVFSSREFVNCQPAGISLVGPSIPEGSRGDETDFPWHRLSYRDPIVYMSLGSQIYYQPEMFKTAVEAVKDKNIQLVLALNDLIDTEMFSELPENVIAVHYTPQLELLKRVRAMITHGGANSVMEALTFGVPMIISPIFNDQFHQAFFVEQAGVGLKMDLGSATPEQCWKALEELIFNKKVRENSEYIRESYSSDGGLAAAEAIERLLAGQSFQSHSAASA